MLWYDTPYLRPFLPEGIYFMRRSFSYFDKLPKKTKLYGASYFGFDDFTVMGAMAHVVCEMDQDRVLYLTDVVHGYCTLGDAVKTLFQVVDAHERCQVLSSSGNSSSVKSGIMSWFVDPKQMQDAADTVVSNEIHRQRLLWIKEGERVNEKPVHIPIRPLENPYQPKAYARSLQALLASDGFNFPKTGPFMPDLLDELCLFPAVPSSSRVGALSILAAGVDEMTAPQKRKPQTNQGGRSAWVA